MGYRLHNVEEDYIVEQRLPKKQQVKRIPFLTLRPLRFNDIFGSREETKPSDKSLHHLFFHLPKLTPIDSAALTSDPSGSTSFILVIAFSSGTEVIEGGL